MSSISVSSKTTAGLKNAEGPAIAGPSGAYREWIPADTLEGSVDVTRASDPTIQPQTVLGCVDRLPHPPIH